MSNVLITGGAGFIGSNLAHDLVEKGNKVTIIDDLSMGRLENLVDIQDKITFIEHDVCDHEFMHELLLKNNFDYIYYLAAVASVADSVERPVPTHKINQESVLDTLEFIRANELKIRRFIFSSSAAVYGNLKTSPKKEDMPVQPLTPYAVDKYASERFTLDYNYLYGVPTAAVRFFNVYGPMQNPESPYSGVLSIITDKLQKNETFTLYGDGSQTRDFVYVGDVVAALQLVAEKTPVSTVYNIADGGETSLNDVIHTYEEVAHRKLDINYLPKRNGDIDKSLADVTKIKTLGFKPKWTLKDGLKEYWDYEEKRAENYGQHE